jgi:hypothetical protein
MGLDTVVSGLILAAFGYWVVWCDMIKPLLAKYLPAKSVTDVTLPPATATASTRKRYGTRGRMRSLAKNAKKERSPRPDAENGSVSRSAFPVPRSEETTESSDVLLPASLEEMQKLAAAIALYTKRPHKQDAIETAWGISKNGRAPWKRASALFDAAIAGLAVEKGEEKG